MAARGGSHPEGMSRRQARTLFLRAPYQDWSALVRGTKREFRMPNMGAIARMYVAPTPVVLYALSPSRGDRRSGLCVLRNHRHERLADIANEHAALAREGFGSYEEFRAYWRERTHRPYRALDAVEVFVVEPWESERHELELGLALLRRLYEDYLPSA